MIQYKLPGDRHYQERLYPDPQLLHPDVRQKLGLNSFAEIIAHFTATSLSQDAIAIAPGSLSVTSGASNEGYSIAFDPLPASAAAAGNFATMHVAMLDAGHFGLALKGADACRQTPAWNPMAGYPVNASDGPSMWLPCLPIGMPIANHRALTLMHYPPIIAYRTANYLNNMTLQRWARLLSCVGIARPDLYHAILDVNPIAAPGSGESEYPNDYFPISLTSMFFDNDAHGLTYVRAMLDLLLNPPGNAANPHTLPLLVCGSPLYDPQAPGWFRTRYKEQLPKDRHGSPTVEVLQAGFIHINHDSPKQTPYLIANHMIAAGVTGACTTDPSKIPDIRKYQAQDLVAASYLGLCADAAEKAQSFDPAAALATACQRWFGAPNGNGPANPPNPDDQLTICALSVVDLNFDPKTIASKYTLDQAREICRQHGGTDVSPCIGCTPLGGGEGA